MAKNNFLYVATDADSNLDIIEQKRINSEISTIVTFISSVCFKTIRIPGVSGIRIDLTDNIESEHIYKPIKGVYPICRRVQYFNFNGFLAASPNEKKEMIVIMVKNGVTTVSHEMNWEIDPILDALNLLDGLNLNFCYAVTKAKAYKSGKVKIHLECCIEPGFSNYDLVIQSKSDKIKRRVISLNAYYGMADIYTGASRIVTEAKWQDERTYLVVGKKGELERVYFKYDIIADKMEISFNLDSDVNRSEFEEEFDLATTVDDKKILKILTEQSFSKWHIYL